MQNDHSNAIRGMSIATIIVAGLCILACVLGFIALGIGGSALSAMTPDMLDYGYDHGYGHGYDYSYGYGYDYGFDDDDALALLGLAFGIGGVALFFELVASAVALVAGIFGLRFYNDPAKMNMVFGWSLAGAIVSFLGGNIVCLVLLIIVCVFSYKDKQANAVQPVVSAQNVVAHTAPAAPAAPAAPTAAQPAAQPAATQPVAQPAAQPAAQPTAQPVAAQPVQPAAQSDSSAQPAAQPTTPEEPKAE